LPADTLRCYASRSFGYLHLRFDLFQSEARALCIK
jgi:hypothetical protein